MQIAAPLPFAYLGFYGAACKNLTFFAPFGGEYLTEFASLGRWMAALSYCSTLPYQHVILAEFTQVSATMAARSCLPIHSRDILTIFPRVGLSCIDFPRFLVDCPYRHFCIFHSFSLFLNTIRR